MNIILIVARLIFPLLILRYPLLGGFIAIMLDNLDYWTKNLFGIPPIGDYQLIDKVLDMYYFSLLGYIALKFKNKLVKNILIGLFAYRVIGFILFEVTHIRALLIVFPNFFESFFFFYYIIMRVAKYEPKMSYKMVALIFTIVAIPKLMHEYALHVIQTDLIINVFGYLYKYEHTWHQMIFLLIMALLFGFYYRNKVESKSRK